MISRAFYKSSYCLNEKCPYYLNAAKKPKAKAPGRWTLFSRFNDEMQFKCASCGKFHSYDLKTGELSLRIDKTTKRTENESKPIAKEEFEYLLSKLDANTA